MSRTCNCLHCSSLAPIHGRGLCAHCYRKPAVRHAYPVTRPYHTTGFVRVIRALVAARIPRREIALRLGCSLPTVASLCSRLQIRNYRIRPAELRAGVARLFRAKHTDARIAYTLGCHPDTVRRYRTELGLARPRSGGPKQARPECWACGAICPQANHIVNVGWACRKGGSVGDECYCPACFARWGWPPEVAPQGIELTA